MNNITKEELTNALNDWLTNVFYLIDDSNTDVNYGMAVDWILEHIEAQRNGTVDEYVLKLLKLQGRA